MKSFSTLCLLVLSLGVTLASAQTRRYVTPTGDGTMDGSTWGNASSDLVGVMANAVPNTEIWVAQGTYFTSACTTCTDAQRSVSFELRPGVLVIGGFVGGETSAAAADPANTTTLSGDIGVTGDPTDNTYNVVNATQVGDAAGLRNLTIRDGYALQPGSSSFGSLGLAGAGIYINGENLGGNSSPTIENCSILDNRSGGFGGAVFISGGRDFRPEVGQVGGESSPVFINCLISGNTSEFTGGAFHINSVDGVASPTFRDTRITNNQTVSTSVRAAGPGGGINIAGTNGVSVITFDRCLLSGNLADFSKPALNGGSAEAFGNTGATGGGMYIQVSGPTNPNVKITFRNSAISKNASYSGGGVYNNSAILRLVNVTVSNNAARGSGSTGGGLYINDGDAYIANSIIFGNQLGGNQFGGKNIRFVPNANVFISHTLVEANSRAELYSCPNNTSDPSTNCAGNTLNDGPGMIYGMNPNFVDPNADVPTLASNSPALDAGSLDSAFTAGGDYFANPRVINAAVDLGAAEGIGAPTPVQLVAFTAAPERSTVRLAWTTAAERDLEGYRLLRSGDGLDFEEIASVPAMGSGDYAYTDRAVVAGQTYYYRLRSVDYDGTTYHSDVVAARLHGEPTASLLSGNVYPNPTAGEVNVTLQPRGDARTVYASIVDLTGRTLKLWPLTTDGHHRLDLGDLPDGNYVLRLREGSREESSAVIVRR